MLIEKLEIEGSNGEKKECFLYKEAELFKLFILSSGFGENIDGKKPEEFITTEISTKILDSLGNDYFGIIQDAIITVNDKLLTNNKRENQKSGGSVLVLMITNTESWCVYLGSISLNLSVQREGKFFKKTYSTENQFIDNEGINSKILKNCLGHRKIVPLIKTSSNGSPVLDKAPKKRNSGNTVYLPDLIYLKTDHYIVNYKQLNISLKPKKEISSIRFLLNNSEFEKAMDIKDKLNLINHNDKLQRIKSNYEILLELHKRKLLLFFENACKSMTGILVEM